MEKPVGQLIDKFITLGIYLIAACLPLYLFRFKIGWLPFDLVEISVYFLFLIWSFKLIRQESFLSQIRRIFKQYRSIWLPALLVLLGALLSGLASTNLKVSAGILKAWFVAPLLLLLIVLGQIKTKKQTQTTILALCLSGTITGLIALIYWFGGRLTYDGRLAAFYLSPNYLAMFILPISILCLALLDWADKKWQKSLVFISGFLLLSVIYLTQSYSAWLALLVSFVFLLIFKAKRKIILLILILLILGLAFWAPTDKFQKTIDFSYPSINSRLAIWQSAWLIIKDHPFRGIGPGMFQEYYLAYQKYFPPYPEWAAPQPHNLFLAFWLQTGLLGLIGFIWLLVNFFRQKKPDRAKWPALIFSAAMIAILTHGLFDTPYWKNDLAICFWLIIGLSYKANRLFG